MELNKIYNEDNLETCRRMPDGFIDLVVTSPPYNKAGLEGFIRKRHTNGTWQAGRNIEYNGDAATDFQDEGVYQTGQIEFLTALYRVVKDGGSLFYNHKNRIKDYVLYSPLDWHSKTRKSLELLTRPPNNDEW